MKITLDLDPTALSSEVSEFIKSLTSENKQAMMKLLVTQEPNNCKRCAGFGVFSIRGKDDKYDLIECPTCGSIHPESLGLRYEKDSAKPFRFIVINNPLEKWRKCGRLYE